DETALLDTLPAIVINAEDGDGDAITGGITLKVDVIDDIPVAVSDIGSVNEDGDPLVVDAAAGVVQTNDSSGADGYTALGPVTAVTGESGDIVGGDTVGLYGTLVLNADGSYTYTVDNANLAVDALNDGESLDDIFTYTITDGDGDTSTANLTITVNGAVDAFPNGLAYTIAGQKGITGNAKDTLYAVDLETGESTTIGQISTGGVTFTSVEGLALNPVDGFLYAIAGGAGSTDYLVKINPATGDSDIIATYALASFSDAGLTFSKDGNTLYMATGSVLNTINPSTGTLTPFIANTGTGAIDGMGISPTDQSTLYIISADDLYTVDIATKVVTLVGNVTFVDLLGGAINSATADGMSFDDNGQLWIDDNAGNIFRYNFSTNTAEQVSTVANEDVTGSGIASLAISVVDPGTYVVLSDAHNVDFSQNRAINESIHLDKDLAVDNVPLTDILSEFNSITVSDAADNAVTVTQNSGDIESAYIQSDANGDITVTGFINVDVQTRGENASSIVINGAERGDINTGEGNDSVTINAAGVTAGLAVDGSETFNISTDGGNDTITLTDLLDSNYSIDAGEAMDGTFDVTDIDTVVIDGSIDLGIGPLSLSNVEILDITGTGGNALTLTEADVLGASDNANVLIIKGDANDSLDSIDTWAVGGTGVEGIDGNFYNAYTSGLATILVDAAVDVSTLID
ncbi:MAG: VCBS domain-containing protein, partial [Gammaproteobacteria bacterium]|nr:VCBS domain-containing protein [Gammaproteobacteria bacterium]